MADRINVFRRNDKIVSLNQFFPSYLLLYGRYYELFSTLRTRSNVADTKLNLFLEIPKRVLAVPALRYFPPLFGLPPWRTGSTSLLSLRFLFVLLFAHQGFESTPNSRAARIQAPSPSLTENESPPTVAVCSD